MTPMPPPSSYPNLQNKTNDFSEYLRYKLISVQPAAPQPRSNNTNIKNNKNKYILSKWFEAEILF